jgi:hypothetical protein
VLFENIMRLWEHYGRHTPHPGTWRSRRLPTPRLHPCGLNATSQTRLRQCDED